MKKILALLIAIFIISSFVACSDNDRTGMSISEKNSNNKKDKQSDKVDISEKGDSKGKKDITNTDEIEETSDIDPQNSSDGNEDNNSLIDNNPFFDSEEKKESDKPAPQPHSPSQSEDYVSSLMSQMSLSEKIYQLMFVKPETITGTSAVTSAGTTTENALKKYPVGGLVYFAYNLQNRDQTSAMIRNSQSYSKIPLFIAVDEEGGVVSRLGSNPNMGTVKHPAMAQVGQRNDPNEAYGIGKQLATDLKSLGFNVDFAPCADVLVNPNNTEIGSRSFGSDPNVCANMVQNVVLGLEENGVSSTLKHFPGHASASVNTHDSPARSQRTYDELRNCEFLSFKAGIDVNVDFIMVSHMTLVNATKEKVPCTLSKEVITDWLLGELGYSGIVITDSLEMKAITNVYGTGDAAVRAISAGADMLLMTPDVKSAHDAIYNAVKSGKLTEERIDKSVRKILTAKYKNGIIK